MMGTLFLSSGGYFLLASVISSSGSVSTLREQLFNWRKLVRECNSQRIPLMWIRALCNMYVLEDLLELCELNDFILL